MILRKGDPVEREDGRFYVPIFHSEETRMSPIVCRVASDAFETLQQAVDFAEDLVNFYNEVKNHG